MCLTCGCGHTHEHTHDHSHEHDHGHAHEHTHENETVISVEQDILSRNNAVAAANRALFAKKKILALNFVSSPGSGKTELLAATIRAVDKSYPIYVIEGDQQTENDADRIRQTGAPAFQINTGKGCHLDAAMVEHALYHLDPSDSSVLFIENVGNLVCPAEFDTGAVKNAMILSVPEGHDKPLKYPLIFTVCDALIINKIDVLPYFDFDMEKVVEYAHMRNPKLKIFPLSAKTGEGVDAWCNWLREQVRAWNG